MDAQALGADYMAEQSGIRVEYETVRVHLKAVGVSYSVVRSTPSRVPTPSMSSKKAIEVTRDSLGAEEHFYYADEFNLSWIPTLRRPCGVLRVGK